jgi:predicted MFS family arabinose efflux permease
MKNRSLVLVVAVVMLFTFITAPPAHAIVPAIAWVVWGIGTAVASVAVAVDVSNQKEQQAQKQREAFDSGGQEEAVRPNGSDVQVRNCDD